MPRMAGLWYGKKPGMDILDLLLKPILESTNRLSILGLSVDTLHKACYGCVLLRVPSIVPNNIMENKGARFVSTRVISFEKP